MRAAVDYLWIKPYLIEPHSFTPKLISNPLVSNLPQDMLHRKVFSQGSVPFSWEDSPGVRKSAAAGQDRPHGTASESKAACTAVNTSSVLDNPVAQKSAIPPPPRMAGPPRRTGSVKGFWGRETDPFLEAYKECTKDSGTKPESSGQSKKLCSRFRVRKSTSSLFSCKSSCDVREDSFVRLSQLPPLPGDRING